MPRKMTPYQKIDHAVAMHGMECHDCPQPGSAPGCTLDNPRADCDRCAGGGYYVTIKDPKPCGRDCPMFDGIETKEAGRVGRSGNA